MFLACGCIPDLPNAAGPRSNAAKPPPTAPIRSLNPRPGKRCDIGSQGAPETTVLAPTRTAADVGNIATNIKNKSKRHCTARARGTSHRVRAAYDAVWGKRRSP